jgi:hypothetical protein
MIGYCWQTLSLKVTTLIRESKTVKNKPNFPRYRAYILAVFTLLSSSPVLAGLASGIAAIVVTKTVSKEVQKSISERQEPSKRDVEFKSFFNAIPQDFNDKQGASASIIISTVYKYHLGNALPREQRVTATHFNKTRAQFLKISSNDKFYIRSVVNLYIFCQIEAELYISNILRGANGFSAHDFAQSRAYTANLYKCADRMKTLPGIHADFSTGYSEIINKYQSVEFKASLMGVKPGDSKYTTINLIIEGLRSAREKTANDLDIILN